MNFPQPASPRLTSRLLRVEESRGRSSRARAFVPLSLFSSPFLVFLFFFFSFFPSRSVIGACVIDRFLIKLFNARSKRKKKKGGTCRDSKEKRTRKSNLVRAILLCLYYRSVLLDRLLPIVPIRLFKKKKKNYRTWRRKSIFHHSLPPFPPR